MRLSESDADIIRRALAIVDRHARPRFAGGGDADGGDDDGGGGWGGGDTPGGGSFGGGLADRGDAERGAAAEGPSSGDFGGLSGGQFGASDTSSGRDGGISAGEALGGHADIGGPSASSPGGSFSDFGAGSLSDTPGGLAAGFGGWGAERGAGYGDLGLGAAATVGAKDTGTGITGLGAIGQGHLDSPGFDNFGAAMDRGVGASFTGLGSGYDLGASAGVAPGYGAGVAGAPAAPGSLGTYAEDKSVNLDVPIGDLVGRPAAERDPWNGVASANPNRGGWAAPGATSDLGPWGGEKPAASYSNGITSSQSPGAAMGTLDAFQSAVPGVTPAGVAGMLGNFAGRESPSRSAPQGVDWGAYNPADSGMPAYGAAQMRGARADSMAQSMGFGSAADPGFAEALGSAKNAQIGYMGSELTSNPAYAASLAAMTNPAIDPTAVAAAITANYERPAKAAAAKAKANVEAEALNAYNNIAAAQYAYDRAAARAASAPAVAGGMAYNAPPGLGVFQGAPAPNAAAAIASAIGMTPGPVGTPAVAPASVEDPGQPIAGAFGAVSPFGAAAMPTGRTSIAGSPVDVAGTLAKAHGWGSFGATPLADDPNGLGFAPKSVGSVGVSPTGMGLPDLSSVPGAKVSSLPGFDNFGVDMMGGYTPSFATKPDPAVQQVQAPPAAVQKAAAVAAKVGLSAVVPGLGVASLLSGMLGGPTLGSLFSAATKDPVANANRAMAIQSGFADSAGSGGNTGVPPATAPAAPAEPTTPAPPASAAPATRVFPDQTHFPVPASAARVIRTGLIRANPNRDRTVDRVLAKYDA